MAGLLHHLGLYVPGPYLSANASNPKGFFESRWSVNFHNRITRDAGIHIFDGRPDAFDRVQATLTRERRARLTGFLRRESEHSAQVVVKDPRTVWTQRLWRDAARDAGMQMVCVTMLRHPAEVVGSRLTYYGGAGDDAAQRRYQALNTARWVNSSLTTERETRGCPRAFVRYADLLSDWRSVAAGLEEQLGLRYSIAATSDEAARVDDFIDPGLRRHVVTWADLEVPADLQDIAQRTADDLNALVVAGGVDADASSDLDRQRARYARLYAEAAAICGDAIESPHEKPPQASPTSSLEKPPVEPPEVDERPVKDVAAAVLLRVVAGRVGSRLLRSRGRRGSATDNEDV
jgi:hypothetical protein